VTRGEAWLLHVSNLLVGGTGLVYAWMRFLAEPADEFALVNHPLQPTFQHLHVLTAPLLVFALGLVWSRHVAPRLQSGQRARRRTGLGLVLLALPMVASGYLLQTAAEEAWRSVWLIVHLSTSGLWLGAYALHLVARRHAIVRGPVGVSGGEASTEVVSSPSRPMPASGTRG
jgi:hypothetical protein